MGAYFEYGAGALDFAGAVSEAGIEEARIVDSELAIGRVKGNHFRGEVGRDADAFPGRQNVKVSSAEDEALAVILLTRLPEFLG